MKEFGLNDVGGTLVLTIWSSSAKTSVKDISAATAIAYVIRKPDETVVEVVAALYTDGLDGQVKYTFIAGDLDQEEVYDVQVKLDGTPWAGQSSSYQFRVRETHTAT